MYGALIIGYLFLGGASAGGFFAMAAWGLAFRRRSSAALPTLSPSHSSPSSGSGARSFFESRSAAPDTQLTRLTQAFGDLQARVYALCLAFLVLAILFLFWDLGSPQRVLLILLHPHATVLTFGALVLATETVLGALLVGATLLKLPFLQERVKRALEILVCIVSLAVMAYTGVFLLGNVGIAFWSTWAIVGLFVCSSLSCGLTLMLLVDYFIQDQTLLLRAARPLQKWHLACLASEVLFVALFVISAAHNPDAAGALEILFSPKMLSTAVVGVLGFGIVIPAASETFSLLKLDCRTIPASDAICLAGGLILRFVIIACGVH